MRVRGAARLPRSSGVVCDQLNVYMVGKVTRPRPGRPATEFTELLDVGPMQKKAPTLPVPEPVIAHAGYAVPETDTLPPPQKAGGV